MLQEKQHLVVLGNLSVSYLLRCKGIILILIYDHI